MQIKRVFTKNHQDPYEGIGFVERVSKITNANGSVVSEIKNVLINCWLMKIILSSNKPN